MNPRPAEITINTPRNRHIWRHCMNACRGLSGSEFHQCYDAAWDEAAREYDEKEQRT